MRQSSPLAGRALWHACHGGRLRRPPNMGTAHAFSRVSSRAGTAHAFALRGMNRACPYGIHAIWHPCHMASMPYGIRAEGPPTAAVRYGIHVIYGKSHGIGVMGRRGNHGIDAVLLWHSRPYDMDVGHCLGIFSFSCRACLARHRRAGTAHPSVPRLFRSAGLRRLVRNS